MFSNILYLQKSRNGEGIVLNKDLKYLHKDRNYVTDSVKRLAVVSYLEMIKICN